MIKAFLLGFYLRMYQCYQWFWSRFFSYIGRLMLIYHIHEGKILTNITLMYHLNLSKYQFGNYYVKMYDTHGTHHFTHNGHISEIYKLIPARIDSSSLVRKKILLMDNDIPCNVDLAILDNYKLNMTNFSNTNMKLILKLLGIKCSHITFLNMGPIWRRNLQNLNNNKIDVRDGLFNTKTVKVSQVQIDDLYF